MIKASELRIGNFIIPVNNKISNFYTIVHGVINNSIFIPFEGYTTKFSEIDFNPIPLTEEWLIKFGFTKDFTNGFHLEDLYSLSISVTKYGEFLACFNDRVLHNELKLKEVHQLQNIYFALTGKELI